jgi:hypothetical protein
MANVTILDRDIEVTQPTGTQLALLAREYGNLKRLLGSNDEGAGLKVAHSLRNVLNIMEKLIKEQVDREFLEDEMIAGNLELDALIPMLSEVFKVEQAPAKPAARRGRPQRSR